MARIHACVDRVLPLNLREEAARVAALENPANVLPSGAHEMAVEKAKLWKPGRTLRVRFLEGSPTIQKRVRDWAQKWTEFANIKFDFVNAGDAEIRIAFRDDGSWSAIGTDCLLTQAFPKDQATMNYGWLTETAPDDVYSGVVLHEFGHALGCIHEHQSPDAKIEWNKEVVYRDLGGPPNNWDKATVDHNVFEKYDKGRTQFSAFDRDSIMLYAFPAAWTKSGGSTKENKQLSSTDKTFIAQRYPKGA